MLAAETGRGGEACFISDESDSTLKVVISGLLRTRAVDPPRASAPLPVAWAMATVMEWIWRTFSRQGEPPITRQMLRLIGTPFTLDIGKAQRELGYRPVVSREPAAWRVARIARRVSGTRRLRQCTPCRLVLPARTTGQFATIFVRVSSTSPFSSAASTASSDISTWGVMPGRQRTITSTHSGL